jgi:hypothetical protein
VCVLAFTNLVEADALTLAKETEHGAFEASWFEQNFGAVVIANDDAYSRCSVEDLDDALHQTFSTLPALIQDVHTRALRELDPCLTRIFWMFGRQVFEERLCEKLTCLPVQGSLPQTSHLYAMLGNPPEATTNDSSAAHVFDPASCSQ